MEEKEKRKENAGAREEPGEILLGGGDGDFRPELGARLRKERDEGGGAAGRYLARTSKVEKVEGERKLPQVFLIIEWPSQETAKAFL